MFIVDLSNDDIVWLAWAAGLAQGTGNDGAQKSLGGILSRIQIVPEQAEETNYNDPTGSYYHYDEPDNVVEIRPVTDEPSQSPPVNDPKDFGAGPPPMLPIG